MKKVFAIALFATLAFSCSKKDTSVESNVMLDEPKVEMSEAKDSASAVKPVQEKPATDSTVAK